MSFYTVIKTEISNKRYAICALEGMKRRGEITNFSVIEKKETIEVNREGDIISLSKEKSGNFNMAGDARAINTFGDRFKQLYAYEVIKDNLPLDFEIAKESETAGEISILLKG